MIAAVLSMLAGLLFLLHALFFVDPYFKTGKSSQFGMTRFTNGIPVAVQMSKETNWTVAAPYHDTSGTGRIFLDPQLETMKNSIHAVTGNFESGTLYVRSDNRADRFLLLLPDILKTLVFAFMAWQIAVILSMIRAGHSFRVAINKRLVRTGWAAIGSFLILTAYDMLYRPFEYYAMYSATGEKVSSVYPDAQNSFSWLIAGCILIILSLAFEKGESLQQEQDLTI